MSTIQINLVIKDGRDLVLDTQTILVDDPKLHAPWSVQPPTSIPESPRLARVNDRGWPAWHACSIPDLPESKPSDPNATFKREGPPPPAPTITHCEARHRFLWLFTRECGTKMMWNARGYLCPECAAFVSHPDTSLPPEPPPDREIRKGW